MVDKSESGVTDFCETGASRKALLSLGTRLTITALCGLNQHRINGMLGSTGEPLPFDEDSAMSALVPFFWRYAGPVSAK